jgi:hypothetical protein
MRMWVTEFPFKFRRPCKAVSVLRQVKVQQVPPPPSPQTFRQSLLKQATAVGQQRTFHFAAHVEFADLLHLCPTELLAVGEFVGQGQQKGLFELQGVEGQQAGFFKGAKDGLIEARLLVGKQYGTHAGIAIPAQLTGKT